MSYQPQMTGGTPGWNDPPSALMTTGKSNLALKRHQRPIDPSCQGGVQSTIQNTSLHPSAMGGMSGYSTSSSTIYPQGGHGGYPNQYTQSQPNMMQYQQPPHSQPSVMSDHQVGYTGFPNQYTQPQPNMMQYQQPPHSQSSAMPSDQQVGYSGYPQQYTQPQPNMMQYQPSSSFQSNRNA